MTFAYVRPYFVIFQFAASKRVIPYPTILSQTRNANASKERRREYSGRSVKISTQKRILYNLRFGRPNICMHRERRDEILRNGFTLPSAGRPPGYGNHSVAASQRLIQSYHNYSLTWGATMPRSSLHYPPLLLSLLCERLSLRSTMQTEKHTSRYYDCSS